jgi:CHAT domain-containing protein
MLMSHDELQAAVKLDEQALKILEALPDQELTIATAKQALATLYWQANSRPKAIALYDQLIADAEASPTTTPMKVGSTILGVAEMYYFGGREDLAKPLLQRALALFDKDVARLEKDKPADYEIPLMLGMSGESVQLLGDLDGAKERLRKAAERDEKLHGVTGSYWNSIAEIERQQGHFKEALAVLERLNTEMAKKSPRAAGAYNLSIATVLKDMGEYKRAEKLVSDHLAEVAKQFGRRHPYYGIFEIDLARIYMATGDVANSERVLGDALEIGEHELSLVLHTGTDNDHAVFFAKRAYLLDTAVSFNYKLAPKRPAATKLALTTLLRRKGRLVDASAAALATLRAKLSPEDKKLLDQLAAARAKLAKLTVAGASGDAGAYAKELAALEDDVQRLELELGKKSASFRISAMPIELAAIQKAIPKDAKLVELVNFQPSDPKVSYHRGTLPPRRYAAYVLGPTGDPVFVDLAAASDIDDAVSELRKALSDPDNDHVSERGRALYQLTVAKLMPALHGTTNVLLAPDGTLNVVPFSALVDDKGDFLVKRYTFTYLTSGRDLLRLAARTKEQGGGVVFANPAFDATGKRPTAGDSPAARGMRSLELASLSWPPLPGTAKEADAVANVFRGLTVLRGEDATEAAVKALHGPRILHLATHGFFLPDDDRGSAASVPGMTTPPTTNQAGENPLLRSGVVLAGANKLASGNEDGILTALEASALDLEGTQLVVLSACETGVGKVTNGDGVYGLRRALVIAGAESLVMSLWQVDDNATKELMIGFYTRLAAGKPPSSALRETQVQLLASDRYKHPYYWASFVPAGDNSAIAN